MKETGRGKEFALYAMKIHPTGLHGYKPKSKESVAGGSQNSEEKSTDSRRKIAYASTTI